MEVDWGDELLWAESEAAAPATVARAIANRTFVLVRGSEFIVLKLQVHVGEIGRYK